MAGVRATLAVAPNVDDDITAIGAGATLAVALTLAAIQEV
jgi:hypothetical protein